jgi:hypothetical protein
MDGSVKSTVDLSTVPIHFTKIRHEARLTLYLAQATQAQPSGEAAAMSDASGNVVSFNTADVYLGKSTAL